MKIQLLDLASGGDHELTGQYIVSYDPEAHDDDGSYYGGNLVTTPDREKATEYDPYDAMLLYRSGPTCQCHCKRDDGERNLPLTAFHAEFS